MHVAQELCDRIGIINHGKLITCEATRDLIGLFSEQAYLFQLNRAAALEEFADLPGVTSVQTDPDERAPHLLVHLDANPDLRSRGLYAVMERLNAHGYDVHEIEHRKQSLERVFLSLTSSPK